MSFQQGWTEKDSAIAKALKCGICRKWLAYCMYSPSWDDERAEREAYYEKHKEHIEDCPNR